MSTVFVGGSRQISKLSSVIRERLEKIVKNGFAIIVGDAAGSDKAVQRYLVDAAYKDVTVYCSGKSCRNNLGDWQTHFVTASDKLKGFQFYAAKDREMARDADFGLMIWDGKSSGTLLNVLRLVRANKKAVLYNVPDQEVVTFKDSSQWDDFLRHCSLSLREHLRDRATPEEWNPTRQTSFLDSPEPSVGKVSAASLGNSEEELTTAINAALEAGNWSSVIDELGRIAKAHGMTQVARDAGLARESLYRSLNNSGNPEFTTIAKVMTSLGLRLVVEKIPSKSLARSG